jgi:rhodanese-related sulfurtransferase
MRYESVQGEPGMSDLITPEALSRQQQAGEGPIVIDVRGADEYAAGHIPGALRIPADELAGRLAEVPHGRPVVTY